ncbi:hypothetical protein SCLAR_v1c04430 [Spiroplasma clarkii]|uniref:Uncharacterized protein n=2 Tax=Spiroplasma clarkii TaxID=2139 RepID=A0A2K8KGE9_9MOLU|nr:hypothetical protein SCLAR_v1c04430 [Spiroplasma clarkii]
MQLEKLIGRYDDILITEYERLEKILTGEEKNMFGKNVDSNKKELNEYKFEGIPRSCQPFVDAAIASTKKMMEELMLKQFQYFQKRESIMQAEINELKQREEAFRQRELIMQAEISQLKQEIKELKNLIN